MNRDHNLDVFIASGRNLDLDKLRQVRMQIDHAVVSARQAVYSAANVPGKPPVQQRSLEEFTTYLQFLAENEKKPWCVITINNLRDRIIAEYRREAGLKA